MLLTPRKYILFGRYEYDSERLQETATSAVYESEEQHYDTSSTSEADVSMLEVVMAIGADVIVGRLQQLGT
jgi:hypothetical protein